MLLPNIPALIQIPRYKRNSEQNESCHSNPEFWILARSSSLQTHRSSSDQRHHLQSAQQTQNLKHKQSIYTVVPGAVLDRGLPCLCRGKTPPLCKPLGWIVLLKGCWTAVL